MRISLFDPLYNDSIFSNVLSFSSLCSLYTGQFLHFFMKSFQYSFFSGGRLVIIPIQSISQHPFRSRNAGHGASDGCIHLHTQLSFSSQHFVIAPPSFSSHIKFSEGKGISTTTPNFIIIVVVRISIFFITIYSLLFKKIKFFLYPCCEPFSKVR